jgi:glycine betaine/proline transport system ATP-binding protein
MAGIEVRNVYKIFGHDPQGALSMLEEGKTKNEVQEATGQVVGVQDVSFNLEPGTLFVIMGLSGSGKSTLLRCINRLVEPTKGEIYVEAGGSRNEIASLSKAALRQVREKQVSMIFQHFALFPFRTVLSNVAFGLEIQGVSETERNKQAQEILDMVGLGAWAKSYPWQLSGGMQQRVGLARGLASGAEVLLMDEPFSALDPLIRMNMQEELVRIQSEVRRTILFISHDLDEALKLGHRIAIMEDGAIVQNGTPEEIIVQPANRYVENFVEQADASGVLTASTISRKVEVGARDEVEAPSLPADAEGSRFASYHNLVCSMDDGLHPLYCSLDGNRMPLHPMEEDLSGIDRRNTILTASEHTTVRQIMRARLETSDNPIVVVNDDGTFEGMITEREILRGILDKGRRRNGGQKEGVVSQ